MKTKITLIVLACLAIVSCTKWHYGHGGHHDDDDPGNGTIYNEFEVDEGAGSAKERIEISPNEIVVRYDSSASPDDIELIRESIRIERPEVVIEECDCGNMDLWIFEPSIEELEIEGVVNGLPRRNPAGKVRNGDRSFNIFLPEIVPFAPQGQSGNEPPTGGDPFDPDIKIAIIDTGIDFYRESITSSTKNNLFERFSFGECLPDREGWNFLGEGDLNLPNSVNEDILDQNGHGTYVTQIIIDELEAEGIDAQILPLKVFDGEGKGSYWDVLCAFAYVKNINENEGNISIVNASFGGAMPPEIFELDANGNKSIFADLLDELNALNTLVLTSAGNKGVDNEAGVERDFLSFFNSNNILSVGGYQYDTVNPAARPIKLHPQSNYGATSIDIALAFNDYQLIFDNPATAPTQDKVKLAGTSYSTAAMSAIAAKAIIEAEEMGRTLTPAQLKMAIFNNSLSVTTGEFEDKIIDNKVILRD